MSSQTTITYANASGATVTLEATTGTVATIANNRITDGAAHYLPAADAAARSLFATITDQTNSITVKAASTASVAGDTALVVAVSPNQSPWAILTSGVATAALAASLDSAVFTKYASLPAATTGQQVQLRADPTGLALTSVLPPGTPFYATSGASGGAASCSAAITATANLMNYCTGFDIDGLGATAGSAIAVTLAGILGGTLTWEVGIPAGVTVPFTYSRRFDPPLQASAIDTAITLTVPSFGSGNTQSNCNIYGFKL
jgi:hypothetical protein